MHLYWSQSLNMMIFQHLKLKDHPKHAYLQTATNKNTLKMINLLFSNVKYLKKCNQQLSLE